MENFGITKFNIRVYGIVINVCDEILVTDEFRLGMRMTKFPGGGLQFGEGTIDCLKREFMEELEQEIEVLDHFYTTDFFQVTSLLKEQQQLISIYYRVRPVKPEKIQTTKLKFDFDDLDGAQTFRWLDLKTITPDELTFPIDKKVLKMLLKHYGDL
jgi:ADP-ribose pyrophosphatase YjhB (NUDIX family)